MALKAIGGFCSSRQREMALILGLIAVGASIPGVCTAAYPERPIRLIVP